MANLRVGVPLTGECPHRGRTMRAHCPLPQPGRDTVLCGLFYLLAGGITMETHEVNLTLIPHQETFCCSSSPTVLVSLSLQTTLSAIFIFQFSSQGGHLNVSSAIISGWQDYGVPFAFFFVLFFTF